METKQLYTPNDYEAIKREDSIACKVVVLDRQVLPEGYSNQLFFCTGGHGAEADVIGETVFLVSLSDGEFGRWRRTDAAGILKPGLLPDSARLQLSQIRPPGAKDLREHEPSYSGYCFLPDGRYASGVWLCDEKEVMDYVELQKPYQYHIKICDRLEFCVMEIKEQKLIFPSQEELQAFAGQEETGGLEMT